MNILVSIEQSPTTPSTTPSDNTIYIQPKQCLNLLNVVKNQAIQSIKIRGLQDETNLKQILIESNRVLQNGCRLELYNDSQLNQETLVSLSKISGFGSVINRGDQNQIVFEKKTIKSRKLKLLGKKVEKREEESKNPWGSNVVLDVAADQNMSINQDDLLKNQEDLAEFKKFAKESDCMTKAKPCENCTCGRAEMENSKNKLETGQVQSNCGKCYLGDAFRCASCPYRGLPAFQPGDQVKLNMGGEQQNVPAERVEVASSKDGKVKLNFD